MFGIRYTLDLCMSQYRSDRNIDINVYWRTSVDFDHMSILPSIWCNITGNPHFSLWKISGECNMPCSWIVYTYDDAILRSFSYYHLSFRTALQSHGNKWGNGPKRDLDTQKVACPPGTVSGTGIQITPSNWWVSLMFRCYTTSRLQITTVETMSSGPVVLWTLACLNMLIWLRIRHLDSMPLQFPQHKLWWMPAPDFCNVGVGFGEWPRSKRWQPSIPERHWLETAASKR